MPEKDISIFKITAVLLIVLVIAAVMGPRIPQPDLEASRFENVEAPIYKNAEFSLGKGEYYVYEMVYGNATAGMTFNVDSGPYCTFLSTGTQFAEAKRACVDRQGNDYSGSNVSLAEPMIFFFKPWMLAVDDNWKWNVSVYAIVDNSSVYVMDINYSTIRTDIIDGRETYVVKIETGEQVYYDWIDKEKRILVKETGGGMTVELVEGIGAEPLESSCD